MKKDKKLIPFGVYCYYGSYKCPYWFKDYQQDIGYCSFLELCDTDQECLGLLWDQVKECGENMKINILLLGEDNCKKCQTVKEFLYKNCIKFDYEDSTEETIKKYKYASIPTLIILDNNGEEIDRAVNKESSLIAKIKEYA
jgi:hypothetical protein